MALNLNNVMLGSEDPKRLADFYMKVLGKPNPDWSDEANGWFSWQAGDGSLAIGPHSEVKGMNPQPGPHHAQLLHLRRARRIRADQGRGRRGDRRAVRTRRRHVDVQLRRS